MAITTSIVTIVKRFVAPALPQPTPQYDITYFQQFNNVLRLYFNRLDQLLAQIVATSGETVPVSIGGTNVDAFGRLRVGQPYTIFDSQNRYAADNQFSVATTGTGSTTYLPNESTVQMSVSGAGVGSVVRQSYRVMPYQPGKSLLVLATFAMDSSTSANLTQRVGYFNTDNGVFFQRTGGVNAFVLRSSSLPTPGTPSDIRTITQANWNGDKLDGTGESGLTLDPSKTQILWMDFEWLGVGNVRCGFIINGEYVVCHTFQNANIETSVYMTTAILPMRYEITTTTSAVAASMKSICCTVISEAGFQQISQEHAARRLVAFPTIGTTFVPLVSIRLASTALGAVVLPSRVSVLPTTSQSYEVAFVKNGTLAGPTTWTAMPTDANVEQDIASTSITGGTIIQTDYVTSSGSGGAQILDVSTGYNWDLQLGVSLAGVSDILTLCIRVINTPPTGDAIGTISFYDLTQ